MLKVRLQTLVSPADIASVMKATNYYPTSPTEFVSFCLRTLSDLLHAQPMTEAEAISVLAKIGFKCNTRIVNYSRGADNPHGFMAAALSTKLGEITAPSAGQDNKLVDVLKDIEKELEK